MVGGSMSFFSRLKKMDDDRDINKKIIIKEVTPQFHAERCPVCNGFGTLKYGTRTCQGCYGKGYVIVPNFNFEGGTNYGKQQNK